MYRVVLWLVALLVVFPGSARAGKLKVVATLPDLAAVAREVGGEHVEVTGMALPTQDPHFVDAKPSLALAVSRADALLLVGLGLEEGWLPTLLTASRNPRIQPGAKGHLDCSRFVTVLGAPAGAVDRSMGDLHGGGNPHWFYDPRAMAAVGRALGARFGELDPANADAYRAGAEAFAIDLDRRRAGWEAELAGLRGMPVLQYHDSWLYLRDWLGFEVVASIEPKPGIPPTPAHIAQVVRLSQGAKPKLVLVESFYPHRNAELVAEKVGARMVVLRAGTDFAGGQRYGEHLAEWVAALKAAAEGS